MSPHDPRDMADGFRLLSWHPAEISPGKCSSYEIFQRRGFFIKVEERAAGPVKRRIHQPG
jgi:hypothetical protein